VTLDVSPRSDRVTVASRRHRRRGLVLVALATFQLWLWGTRIWNLLGDASSFTTAFVGVHLVLYVTAIAAGAVIAVIGVGMLREARRPGRD